MFVARNREREKPWLTARHGRLSQGMLLSSLNTMWGLIEIGVLDLVIFFPTSTFSMKLQNFNFFSSCSLAIQDGFIQEQGHLVVNPNLFYWASQFWTFKLDAMYMMVSSKWKGICLWVDNHSFPNWGISLVIVSQTIDTFSSKYSPKF